MKSLASRVGGSPRRNSAVSIAVALAIQTSLMQMASAQDGAEAAKTDELAQVTITGSRIARRDYEANSPIQTVDCERPRRTRPRSRSKTR